MVDRYYDKAPHNGYRDQVVIPQLTVDTMRYHPNRLTFLPAEVYRVILKMSVDSEANCRLRNRAKALTLSRDHRSK